MPARLTFGGHKMTYIEKIVNSQTGEVTERPYTAQEIAEVEAAITAGKIKEMEAEIKATEKAALLAKLGITEDEARLLLS
jgi:uncharacterized protein (DUF169 family)